MANERIRARRSQLVTTYGVGSLFPSENASYVVLGLHEWDERKLPNVSEPRLARQLRVQAFKAPPATPDNRQRPGVPVSRFPRTLVCPACHSVGTLSQLKAGDKELRCGVCDDRPALMPSRFVVSCEDGHIADFPYYQWVHKTFPPTGWARKGYDPEQGGHILTLKSRGRSSALSDLVVHCQCGKSRDLGEAFSRQSFSGMKCSGERPWLGFVHRAPSCGKQPRTLQRGASNVWFGANSSAISIPPFSDRLTAILFHEAGLLTDLTADDLRPPVEGAARNLLEAIRTKHTIQVPIELVAEQALQIKFPLERPELSPHDFRYEEYQAIVRGAPDDPDNQFVSEQELVAPHIRDWVQLVRRIPRLREVSALRGFTRLSSVEQPRETDAGLCALYPENEAVNWLPATELLGEGLFIGLDARLVRQWAETDFARKRIQHLMLNAEEAMRRRRLAGEAPVIEAAEVALHTLAHIVIDQLSLDAGYPASALRERLYVGKEMAGILIYTASSDSAGSLGGVASMAVPERLGAAIEEAVSRHDWCSADPVCRESKGSGVDGVNLAACHNCLLLPETSCELFNSRLDRVLLLGDRSVHAADGLIEWMKRHGSHTLHPRTSNVPDINPGDQPLPDHVSGTDWEEYWQEFPSLRKLIEELAGQDFDLPELGAEIGSGSWIVDLAWPGHEVAVSADPNGARDSALQQEGWTVLVADSEGGLNVAPHLVGILTDASE
jgi:hypothetical protein